MSYFSSSRKFAGVAKLSLAVASLCLASTLAIAGGETRGPVAQAMYPGQAARKVALQRPTTPRQTLFARSFPMGRLSFQSWAESARRNGLGSPDRDRERPMSSRHSIRTQTTITARLTDSVSTNADRNDLSAGGDAGDCAQSGQAPRAGKLCPSLRCPRLHPNRNRAPNPHDLRQSGPMGQHVISNSRA